MADEDIGKVLPRTVVRSVATPTGKARLQIDRIYDAASRAETALPTLVSDLIDRMSDPDVKISIKDRVSAMQCLMAVADVKPRLEDDLGLTQAGEKSESPIMLLLNSSGYSIVEIRGMKAPEREALILKVLNGDQVRKPKTIEATIDNG